MRLTPLATAAGLALTAATAATLAARVSWFFDLFSHFRWQYVLLAGVTIPLLWKCGRRTLALVSVAALCVHLYALSVQRFGPAVGSLSGGRPLRVVSLNVRYSNHDYAAVIGLVERESPDIVCLYETTPAWQENLAPLTRQFAFALYTGNGPRSGLACMSRRKPARVVPPAGDGIAVPWMRLDYELDGATVAVFAAHLYMPVTPAGAARRNRQLEEFAEELRVAARPTIAVGDFNLSPYSPHDRDFSAASGLRDCSRGRPLAPTWPTRLAPLWIQIDRCFLSAGVGLARYGVGGALGSDHYPLLMDFMVGARVWRPAGRGSNFGDGRRVNTATSRPGPRGLTT